MALQASVGPMRGRWTFRRSANALIRKERYRVIVEKSWRIVELKS
jgi:hypothetical protein